MVKNKTESILKFSATALILSLLSGCLTDLDNAGVDTSTSTDIEPIIYRGGFGFTRYAREAVDAETGQVSIEYFYERSDVPADFATLINSAGIYGMSADAQVPVQVVSVKDITNTTYDPRIRKTIIATTEECIKRNENTKTSNENAKLSWQEAVADAEENGRPLPDEPTYTELEACDDIDYIYALMSYTPLLIEDALDVTNEGFFKYQLKATLDIDTKEYNGTNASLTSEPGQLMLMTNITPTFDLRDDQWERAYQAIIQVGNHTDEFIINTALRNPQIDPKSEFLTSKRNLKPGRYFDMEPITFSGFNTNAPVVLTKTGSFTDFDIFTAVGSNLDENFSLYTLDEENPLTIRAGQRLYIRVQSKEGDNQSCDINEDILKYYDQELALKIEVGEEGTEIVEGTAVVHTQPIDYLPGADLTWQYPVAKGIVLEDNMELRGKVYTSYDQLEFSNNCRVPDANIPDEYDITEINIHSKNTTTGALTHIGTLTSDQLIPLESESEYVEIINPETNEPELKLRKAYAWQYPVPLVIGDNAFTIDATSNLTRTWPDEVAQQVAISEPIEANTYYVNDIENVGIYPSFLANSVLEQPVDLTLNPMDNSLYILDKSGNNDDIVGNQAPGILWRYALHGRDKISCLTLPWSWQDAGVNGVQFNHAISKVGGVVIGSSPGNLAYYDNDDLDGDISQSNMGQFQTNWEGVKHPGHFAYSADGTQLFMTAKSDYSFDPKYQGIVGLKTPNIEDFVFKGFGSGIGIIAKETTSSEDAARLYNNAVSLDIFSRRDAAELDQVAYNEWLLVLDGKDNTASGNFGETYLRKIQVRDSYTPETAAVRQTLVDSQGNPIRLYKADAIAVSSSREKAYIVDNKDKLIYEVDLANIAQSDALTATLIASPDHPNQPTLGNIKSLVIEGDMDYMVIADVQNGGDYSALITMDLESRQMGYILKTNNTLVGDESKTHCEQ
ncbi:hypothetical protein [Echinimonas agarilytica]|uniref:Uncharacterized protein n=1 Tax=Echinimonas agarilytica TaxID=1215918 RepID=A0AA41WBN4_9GAMM|nr:hypothetical protein [Echinimonas agarilytica]MCM2681523.1 hypothetical protein [Echinimonas agarilytica]